LGRHWGRGFGDLGGSSGCSAGCRVRHLPLDDELVCYRGEQSGDRARAHPPEGIVRVVLGDFSDARIARQDEDMRPGARFEFKRLAETDALFYVDTLFEIQMGRRTS